MGHFLVCAGRSVENLGFPTLSLGPNGFHFARLPSDDIDKAFPAPKHLNRLFPHFEECKFVYAKDSVKLSKELLSFEVGFFFLSLLLSCSWSYCCSKK